MRRKIFISIFVAVLSLGQTLTAQSSRDSLDYYYNLKEFEHDFYALQYGRMNDDAGQGQKWYKRFCIFHVTDVHGCNDLLHDAVTVARGKADVVVGTGDDASGVAVRDSLHVRTKLDEAASTVMAASKGEIPYMSVPGNHDVAGIRKEDFFNRIDSMIGKLCPGVVWGDPEGCRSYGYADFGGGAPNGSFRIILLDPFDYDDREFGTTRTFMTATFSQKQVDWLVSTLRDAAAKGLHVITAMHYSFGDNSLPFTEELAKPDAVFYQDPFMIPDIIDAIQHKKVLKATYRDEKGKQNIRVNEDFRDVADLDYVCHLFGHIHSRNEYRCQKTDGSKEYDILMIGEASLSTMGTALNKIIRTQGTLNEIQFSALLIDTVEKNIYRVGYGAGTTYNLSDSGRLSKISYKF